MVLFNLVAAPPPLAGLPAALFCGAFGPTGYNTFVEVLKLVGGVIVMMPRLRNFGLLLLGPIVVNILAFHLYVGGGVKGFANPMLMIPILLTWYWFWAERTSFARLLP